MASTDGLDTDRWVILVTFASLLYLYINIACVVTGVCRALSCQCRVLTCVGTLCVQLGSRPFEYTKYWTREYTKYDSQVITIHPHVNLWVWHSNVWSCIWAVLYLKTRHHKYYALNITIIYLKLHKLSWLRETSKIHENLSFMKWTDTPYSTNNWPVFLSVYNGYTSLYALIRVRY